MSKMVFFIVAFVFSTPAITLGQLMNRSVDELSLMTEPELYGEAVTGCVLTVGAYERLAVLKSLDGKTAAARDALRGLEYLDRVYLVARKVNGGNFPLWVEPIKKSVTDRHWKGCAPLGRADEYKGGKSL